MGKAVARERKTQALRDRRIPRARLQFGALCYRFTGKKKQQLRILMISSRRTRRWVSPKGWPMHGKTGWEAAAQEAWEEAGVRGMVAPHSIGFYTYRKNIGRDRFITCTVQVFPLEVKKRIRDFPEKGERTSKWMKPKKAAKSVAEPELAQLIRRFAKTVKPGQPIGPEASVPPEAPPET